MSPIFGRCVKGAFLKNSMHAGTSWMQHVHEMFVLITRKKGRSGQRRRLVAKMVQYRLVL